MSDVTQILDAVGHGENASKRLLPLVYEELRKLAAYKMANEPAGHTLQPTALVHEAWLRLVKVEGQAWENKAHFFAAAAEAMRRILVDHARRRLALKRGGGTKPLDIDEIDLPAPVADDESLLRLHDVLDRLQQAAPRKAELVKLRYFVGMTYQEAAAVLGISVPTAKQWWAYARAWMATELGGDRP